MADSKRILLTGGTGALGTTVVSRLAEAGHRLHLTLGPERKPDATFDNVTWYPCDVTSEESVAVTLEKVGELDAVVHLVGGFAYAPLGETSLTTWRHMMTLNAQSAFLITRATMPRMPSGGSYVFISSVAAMGGTANMSAYAASKAAVTSLMESVASELKNRGLRANAILPTIIDSKANRESMPDADRSTWIQPDEVANVIEFLISDSSRAVTGSQIILGK